jgi:hypothetical protein
MVHGYGHFAKGKKKLQDHPSSSGSTNWTEAKI